MSQPPSNVSAGHNGRRLTCYVIGSGPAGVACAHALVERGANVRLLDGGIALEPERAELAAQLQRTSPASWTSQQITRLKAGTDASAKGIPLKLAYGSDFPYRECDEHLRVQYDRVALRPSLAKGGHSNVWGAAMLPYRDHDIADWPIDAARLALHYEAATGLIGVSARRDDLESLLPLYTPQPAALALSEQATILLDNMQRNRVRLTNAGVRFGQARVAVRVAGPESSGCVYCGLCMYGCPYGYIYNSVTTLQRLQQLANFEYTPGIVVTQVRESGTGVVVEGFQRVAGAPFAVEADRVYLAAGTIATTQILLRSIAHYDQRVAMKDSQYFLFPLALTKAARDAAHESLHTLSQLFLEILDQHVSPYTVHLQLYSYNDLIGQTIRKAFGPLAKPLEPLARHLENRLLIVQGYLHSTHSSQIAVTLQQGTPDRLHLQMVRNDETKPTIRRIVRKLTSVARQTGAIPVSPMLQIAEPGRGFHSGGTFPMRTNPGPLETDTLGRPHGWTRIFAVDSTVFPSIPATTITLSAMANAHRIGWESMDA